MTEQLVITSFGHRGDGVADGPGGPVYVPYTLPGESVETETVPGHPDRRNLLRVLVASPERIAPICPHFGICGGCAVQHWSETLYRPWKRNLVVEALQQAGIDAPVDDLIDAHGAGRRRATFHARRGARDVLEVGFAAARAHHVIGIDRCPVLAPSLDGAVAAAWAIAEELAPERKPLDIQVTATETGLDIDVRGSGPLRSAKAGSLARLAEKLRIGRLTRHGELVAQRATPTVTMGRSHVTLPPGSFLQATEAGEATLARLVQAHAGDAKAIADLFCGVGPFALRLALQARIIAADSDAGSIAALKQAAQMTSGLKPIDPQARDLFRRPFVPSELKRIDAVVFDPPRQGAESQARELAKSDVKTVIAVSCNVATLARDTRILIDGGYRMTAVTPVDQFRYSAHIEVVARLERR